MQCFGVVHDSRRINMERMITHIWTNHGTNQHPNGHWSALCERKRRNSTVHVFRCNNPILILRGGAEIIPQRIAPEWCVVALTTTCSTSPSINGHNLHMFIEKATRLPQND